MLRSPFDPGSPEDRPSEGVGPGGSNSVGAWDGTSRPVSVPPAPVAAGGGPIGDEPPARTPLAGAARWAPGLLGAILLVAAALRFVGLNWDDGHHLHPDERFITMVAERIRIPSSVEEYFDTARSPLNPYNKDFGSYVYGTFPLFFVRAVAEAIQGPANALPVPTSGPVGDFLRGWRAATGYGEIILVGRALSGIADILTIVLIFLIGRRLYGSGVGLLAAFLASFTVLQIQAAHFFTAESPLTLFCTLAFYLAIRVSETISLRYWALLGIVTGLAAATKITALMLGAVVLAASWVLWYRTTRLREAPERRKYAIEDVVTGLAVVGALALVGFRIAQPYAFTGPSLFDVAANPKYVADLETWQRFATGEADYPPSHQWTGATPYVWQLTNMTLWGMGPPLVLAAWLGFALAAAQFIRDPRRHYGHLLGLVWVGLNFAYWGVQFTKPMRYLLPIYPQLTIFAAFFVVWAWQWARSEAWPPVLGIRSPGILLRAVGRAGAVGVVGWTVLYGLAFASIYTRPTTRVAASEWIYEHVPPQSRIAWEHWDDPLPLRIGGNDAFAIYKGVELPMYNEDTVDKRSLLISKLDEADYIVLSSNRLYGAIPKLPQRYPMTTRYYGALFAGELGFEPVAELTSRPALFGVELNDDSAEELFTVYEHPKVTIFKKSPSYSTTQVRRVLEEVPLDHVVRGLKPIQARTGGLLLSPAQEAAARAGGTWSEMFRKDSLSNAIPLLVWYLTVQLLGLAALPLTWFVCRRLADGGYPLSKTIGLVAIAYVPWLLASVNLMPYGRLSVLLAAAFLGAASALVLARHGEDFLHQIALRWRPIVAAEALFGVAFLAFTAIRAANPDLWHANYGGEKPMDYAYLNAVIKTTWFPPYDPWFAGGYINYYYFGQVIVGSLTKLTGIVPWVAFNLAIPTIAALTAISVGSAVYNLLLSRPAAPVGRQLWAITGGMIGAVLAVVSGNLHGFVQLVDWLAKLGREPLQSSIPGVAGALGVVRGAWILLTSSGDLPPFTFDFWAPTRVINAGSPTIEPTIPITEFPFFTFLYGDLHAHMIAMPLGLMVVGLAVNLIRQPPWVPAVFGRPLRETAAAVPRAAVSSGGLTLLLAGLMIGIIRMTNSWDYPTYLGLIGAAVLLAEAVRSQRQWGVVIGRTVVLAGLVAVASQLLIGPYIRHYELFYAGLELSKFRTPAPHYLIIMGCFLGIAGLYLGFQLSALRNRLAHGALSTLAIVSAPTSSRSISAAGTLTSALSQTEAGRWDGLAVGLGVAAAFLAVLLLLAGIPVVGIAVAGIGALGMVAILRQPAASTLLALLLVATALAITAGVEIVVLKGDIGRMNTVFKFYLQAWLFLAIAGGVLLVLLGRRGRGSGWLRAGYRGRLAIALIVLMAMTLIYPILGTPAKLQHRFLFLPPSLDGMEYMSQARYQDEKGDMMLPDDFAAINWMLDTLPGSPVIVEGLAPLYHWRSRVSIYTGLPTVIGWDWHQKQQRGDFGSMVDDRVKDVDTIFASPSPEAVRPLLDRYKVDYVYVGGLERGYYPRPGIEKFDRMVGSSLERIYQHGVVTIYRVLR